MLKIHFLNWWTEKQPVGDFFHIFLQKFINSDIIFDSINPDIVICSVFGYRQNAIQYLQNRKCVKIFFTGECLNQPRWTSYKDHLLDYVDIALGFEYLEHEKYIRFPLWLTYINTNGMGKYSLPFENLLRNNIPKKDKFCCLLNNHDIFNTRTKVFDKIMQYKRIDSAGRWKKTVTYKIPDGEDNKQRWMKPYKFNLCCESFMQKGYVTEKIFESIICGCIPIYIVDEETKYVEPEILNQNWILKFTKNELPKLMERIKLLDTNEEEYQRFIEQPKITGQAEKMIENKYKELAKRIFHLKSLY